MLIQSNVTSLLLTGARTASTAAPVAATVSTVSTSSTVANSTTGTASASDTQLTATQSAHEKIDADYAKAAAQGTKIVADISNGGRALDLSSLTDEEVATMALNRDSSFTADEKLTAEAELNGRMFKALAPFSDGNMVDVAGEQSAIKAMYPALSQDVRDALGWTPAMLTMTDSVLAEADGKKPSSKSLFDMLDAAQKQTGALKIDMNLVQTKGSSVNVSA